jgi:peptide/nickel transport system permease protein
LIPTAATIGGILPSLFGGELIVSQVLGIPTMGPILFNAVRSQDMFLAGSIVLIISSLAIVGNLVSDIIVGIVDPRIRGAV